MHVSEALRAEQICCCCNRHPLTAQGDAARAGRAGARRIVLATPIAEASLTVAGVRAVVDAGLARRPQHDAGAGLSRLRTVRVSAAAADQRRGRAGAGRAAGLSADCEQCTAVRGRVDSSVPCGPLLRERVQCEAGTLGGRPAGGGTLTPQSRRPAGPRPVPAAVGRARRAAGRAAAGDPRRRPGAAGAGAGAPGAGRGAARAGAGPGARGPGGPYPGVPRPARPSWGGPGLRGPRRRPAVAGRAAAGRAAGGAGAAARAGRAGRNRPGHAGRRAARARWDGCTGRGPGMLCCGLSESARHGWSCSRCRLLPAR